jgi:hypothetical protein
MFSDHLHLGVKEMFTDRAYYPQVAFCAKCRSLYTYYVEVPKVKRTAASKERRKLIREARRIQ